MLRKCERSIANISFYAMKQIPYTAPLLDHAFGVGISGVGPQRATRPVVVPLCSVLEVAVRFGVGGLFFIPYIFFLEVNDESLLR